MFDSLKQLAKMKELKAALEKERREVEKEGVKVVVNGKMEIEELSLNPQLDPAKQEELVKGCINQAIREIQQEAVRRMVQGN